MMRVLPITQCEGRGDSMKRPLTIIGFSYLAALVAATYFNTTISRILTAIFLLFFVICLFIRSARKKKVLPIAFLTISIAFIAHDFVSNTVVKPLEQLHEQDVEISGCICELPYRAYNRYYYVVETDKVGYDGANQKMKLRISMSKALDADLYDRITGKVHMFLPTDTGGFSSRTYYAAKGIYMLSYLYEYEDYNVDEEAPKPAYYYFLKAKQTLIESIRILLPKDHAAVAVGVLLGDKYFLDDDIKTNFKEIGISHLLAVSGLHTSMIAAVIFRVLQATKLRKNLCYLFTCVGVVGFMALTGFSASVMRAGIMLIMFYLGKFFFAKADSLNSLGIATLLLTAVNPFAAGDMGLLLSVSSTLGIILFEEYFEKLIKRVAEKLKFGTIIVNKLSGSVAVTFSATLSTMPVVMLSFGRISLISIVSNILLVSPTMLMMIFILLASVFNLIPVLVFLAKPLALFSGILINYVTFCAQLLAKIPFASVSTTQPFILFWLASTCVLIVLSLILFENYSGLKLATILSSIMLFVGVLSFQLLDRGITHLAILDTGNGCSALLSQDTHVAVLSCGGDEIKSSVIESYLNSQNVKKLDYLLLGDFEDSTAAYANDIIKKFEPHYVVMSEDELLDDKLERSIADSSNTIYFHEKATISFGDNVKITLLKLENESFIYLNIDDVNILISPSVGNAASLPDEYKICDILVTSNNLENLENISSAYGIVTADLPNAEAFVTKLALTQKTPLATAGDGNIIIDLKDKRNITFRRIA